MSAYTDMQSKFFFNLCRFGLWLEIQGYQVGGGELWRTDQQAQWNEEHGVGIRNSLHKDRMACDLVIRKDGKEVGQMDYLRAGNAWKAINPLNRWGGDIANLNDMQHFSMSPGGGRI